MREYAEYQRSQVNHEDVVDSIKVQIMKVATVGKLLWTFPQKFSNEDIVLVRDMMGKEGISSTAQVGAPHVVTFHWVLV